MLGLGRGPERGLSWLCGIGRKRRVRRKRYGTKLHPGFDNSFHRWNDSTDHAADSGRGIGLAG